MTGAEAAVRARLASLPLRTITIDLWQDSFREAGLVANGRGRIFVEPHDSPARLDFRVCHGMTVHIHTHGDERGLELFERVKEFNPRAIVMVMQDSIVMWNPRDGLTEYEG